MRRRILKYLLIGLLVLAFAGYFAFSTFLFSPTEGDYEYDLSTLIPREVDFYLSKADLQADFAAFPRLAVADDFERSAVGSTFLASPEWEAFRTENGVDEQLVALQEALDSLPISIDVLNVFGGEDVAVAGFLRGPNQVATGWAVYGRCNWMGKLGLALLHYPDAIGLPDQGLVATTEGDVVTLSGGQLEQPLFVTRVNDVLIAGADSELVSRARDLQVSGGRDSFGQSARYDDFIDRSDRAPDEIELFGDYQALAGSLGLPGRWPDTQSEDFLPAYMGRLFQASSLKELVGTVRFAGGVGLNLHGEFSSELLTQVQKSLYRAKGLDRQDMKERVAVFVPRDTGLMLYIQADVGDMVRQALNACDSATLSLLEEPIRNVWGKGTADEFVGELETAFHDRALLIMRENDYPPDPEGPPHNADPVPAWTAVFWVGSDKKVQELHQKIRANQSFFGFQGHEPGASGVFLHELEGGFQAHEFWSQAIPGTGHIATASADDFFLVSNHFGMISQVLKTRFEGGDRYPRLTSHPEFGALLFESLPSAGVTVWANPRTMGDALRKMLRRTAERSVEYDPRLVRSQKEREVLKEKYPGQSAGSLSGVDRETFNDLVDQRMRDFDAEFRGEHVPVLYQKYERNVTYAETVRGALLQLAIQPKFFDLSLRVAAELESQP